MTYCYSYERAVNASTVALLTADLKKILVGKRHEKSDAFPGVWCLPGGILDVGKERMINVTRRETKEECGIDIEENRWVLFYVDDAPGGTDPRFNQVVNLCYYAFVTDEEYNEAIAGDDISETKWITIEEARNTKLAFEHNEVLEILLGYLNDNFIGRLEKEFSL